MTLSYADFLATKRRAAPALGRPCDPTEVHPFLHPWQAECVAWAVRKGRAALWWDTGLGKALESDTRVITPTGTRRIAELEPGEHVIGADGRPTEVIGVYPQGLRPAYRVGFSDDTSVVCDDEHLWSVRTKVQKYGGRSWQVKTLREIRQAGIGSPSEGRYDRWFIPMVEPVEFRETDIPLHPYLLGCLLGDGHIKGNKASISSADPDLIDHLREIVPLGVEIIKRRYSKYDYDFVRGGRLAGRQGGHYVNPMVEVLTDLGVQGHGAESKFIPDCYKYAAADTRLLVLQGLMDTDGSVWDSRGTSILEFCTVSSRLAEDFLFLVQSLGGRGRIRTKQTNGRLAYRITPALPQDVTPFLLKRKAGAFKPRTKYMPARSIRSIEHIGDRHMTCIKVSAADGLFVADGFIVTHNTVAQLEWARLSGARALIVAPLAVCRQTVAEAAKLGIDARYVREDSEHDDDRIRVTNYELADRFDPTVLDAVVLDEASILKNEVGKRRTQLIKHFAGVPARLACTATPAPNDPAELTNQAEFLGLMTRPEMLASYFIHDSDGWRVKGHARGPMMRWMSSWAVALRRPSDIGGDDTGYVLPHLDIRTHLVETGGIQTDDTLFAVPGDIAIKGVTGRAAVRKSTVKDRVARAVEIVKAELGEPWLLWAGRNDEADGLASALPGAVNVHGSMSPEEKADALLAFAAGDIPILVTKPSIASFGLNLQVCARMAFVGLSDSYEAYYQCVRRCWRHGQQRDVTAHVVLTDAESVIADNIAGKQAQAAEWTAELVAAMNAPSRREIA